MADTAQIESELQACINDSGELILDGDAFGSATMATAFATYLPNAQLVILNATVLPATDTEVTVTGTGGTLFSTLTVSATFTPTTSSDIAVVVTGAMLADYCLSSAFQSLAEGIYAQLPFVAGGSLVLNTLPEDGAAASLTLEGSLVADTSSALSAIAAFLTGTDPIAISGAIDVVNQTLDEVTSQTPSFNCSAPVAQALTVGTLTADFTLLLNSSPYLANVYDTDTSAVVPTYTTNASPALQTDVTFSAGGAPMTVTVTMPFTLGPQGSLAATIAGAPSVSLDTFTEWAAGISLTSGLPSLFDPSQYLTLDGLSFTFTMNSGVMETFNVAVSTTEAWVVIPDLITVGDITFTLSSVMNPSPASVAGTMVGNIVLDATPPVTITIGASYPTYDFYGGLADGSVVDLSALLAYLIPTAVDIPQIDLTEFDFYCSPSDTNPLYTIDAMFSSDWVLDVGPFGMSITSAWVNVSYGNDDTGSATTTGTLGGTIVFNSDITFAVTYAIPGTFSVGGVIPEINLTALIAELVNIVLTLPADFELAFSNCVIAICYSSGGDDLSFQVSADVSGLGAVSFEALDDGGQWGYAVGLSLGDVAISNVPGLSALSPFDDYFSFQSMVLVVSTSELGDFTFPAVPQPSGVNATSNGTTSTQIKLPDSQSVVTGMNAYAEVDLNGQPGLQTLMLILNMEAMLQVTLMVGMSDVGNDSSVTAGITGEFNSNMQVTGDLISSIVGDVVAVSVEGTLDTVIQSQPISFSLLISFEPNGLLLSGSYTGTIDFVIVKLSNLILEIGVDFEEIPTIGFGAQIDTTIYESAVMILFDSVIPTQSMFIGSVSEMSLGIFVDNLCGTLEQQPPDDLMNTLNVVNISGTNPFSLADADDSVATALNDMDVPTVSAAFATAGISLPSDPTQVIISVATASSLWFVTDMVNLLYYTLTKAGSGSDIAGSLDPQLYVVPQTTQLGTTVVPAGLKANAALNLFGFSASVEIEIVNGSGFTIDVTFTPIVITVSNYPVFSLTGSDSDSSVGPALSVCTFTSAATDSSPEQEPHFYASGYVSVLGVVAVGVTVNFTESGGSFDATASLSSTANYTFSGSYSSAFDFSLSGSCVIGVDQTFDFGVLGTIDFNSNVNYSYDVAVTSATSGSASASGGFEFEGIGFSIPSFTLPLDSASLAAIATDAASQVESVLQAYLTDSINWLTWLDTGVIQGITGGAEEVGQILASSFTLDYDSIATQTTDILDYSTDEVTQALQGAGATSQETYDVLVNTLGVPADEATASVEEFFTGVSHVDIAHVDSTGAHVDDSHTDTKTDHVDDAHTDTKTDHVDTTDPHDDAHWDTWPDHSHTDSKPHDDTALHTDIGHDDTALHTDLPHDDTSAHYDTPHSDIPA